MIGERLSRSYAFSPEGIFVDYPQPEGEKFDPTLARQLLAEADFSDEAGSYDPEKFPVGEVEYTYVPVGPNKDVAEFVQAQWKQNLNLTIGLKFEFYQMSSKKQPSFEKLGGCLNHPIPLST
ncbi:MAG: ABC transporter substrate-binding protein [Pyrinomonadaceae bacterium]